MGNDVHLQWGARIKLRDGVHLNATLYRPPNQCAPAPAIFTLTPYIGQTYHDFGMYFAARGYPFLTVDVRGRGDSEGTFWPFLNEAQDGYDVVEWLAREPYCDGRVAMWGGSYAGYNQWVTAKEFPPHLATIVPVAAPYLGCDYPRRNNIGSPYVMQWLTLVRGHASQEKIFGEQSFWRQRFGRWFESGAAFKGLDRFLGEPSPIFQKWLAHPRHDEYWDRHNPAPEQYARLSIPILTITGIYDGDQPGALMYYREYMRNASAAGRARHYLVIGPWDHAGTRTPKREFAAMQFGPESLVDLPQLHAQWYEWTMQGGRRPAFLRKNVAYYVTGAETWRYADTLDDITAETRPFYLDSRGGASRVFASGVLCAEPGTGHEDSYVYDPCDTRIAALEAASTDPLCMRPTFPTDNLKDQAPVLAQEGRQLVYHSGPLDRDVEISGFFRLSVWLAIDQPDTDFRACVFEIGLDGSSVLLSADCMRARYRESFRTEALVRTRDPLRYDFERFTFTSRRVQAGSRLRLVIGPNDSIYSERNFNGGGVVAEESLADARVVMVKLFHNPAYPSALYVPFAHMEP